MAEMRQTRRFYKKKAQMKTKCLKEDIRQIASMYMALCWLKKNITSESTAAGTTLGFFLLFSSSDLTFVS
jgi:hypothetical protein